MDIFTKVKENVSMLDLIQHFNLTLNRQKFICCPFHNEKTPSLKVYENSFYCFGCNKSGTVIDFTSYYLNMDILEATRYLASSFSITLDENIPKPTKLTVREKYEQDKAIKQNNKSSSTLDKVFENWLSNAWDTILNYYRILHHNSLEYELNNEIYVEAIHNLTKLDYYIDWLQDDPISFYKINRDIVKQYEKRLNKINDDNRKGVKQ